MNDVLGIFSQGDEVQEGFLESAMTRSMSVQHLPPEFASEGDCGATGNGFNRCQSMGSLSAFRTHRVRATNEDNAEEGDADRYWNTVARLVHDFLPSDGDSSFASSDGSCHEEEQRGVFASDEHALPSSAQDADVNDRDGNVRFI